MQKLFKTLLCLTLCMLFFPHTGLLAAGDTSAGECTCDFIWPLGGTNTYITSYYGGRIHPITGKAQNHSGIDIRAPKGTAVYAAEEGVLNIAYDKCTHNYGKNAEQMKACGCGSNYGNHVYIVHPDGKNTLYAHLSSIDVADGAYVKKGQQIATVGSTGRSTGYHLHFEVRMSESYSSRVDPLDYVSVPSFIKLGEGSYDPRVITRGDGYYLDGGISSIYTLTSVTVAVYNEDGTPTPQKKSYYPGGTSCNISELDAYIHFGRLEAGNYILRIEAADGSGAHSTLLSREFSVMSRTEKGILESFEKNRSYKNDTFCDVQDGSWYCENTRLVYELGLMQGIDTEHFDPAGSVTVAQAVTLASRIHSSYYGKTIPAAKASQPWYQPYADYAMANGIADCDFADYDALVSREQFAAMLAHTVSSADLQERNMVADGAIADVPMSSESADGIYMLYRAGVLTGSDQAGSFYPHTHISRAEAAAMITRIVCPEMRRSITLG